MDKVIKKTKKIRMSRHWDEERIKRITFSF